MRKISQWPIVCDRESSGVGFSSSCLKQKGRKDAILKSAGGHEFSCDVRKRSDWRKARVLCLLRFDAAIFALSLNAAFRIPLTWIV